MADNNSESGAQEVPPANRPPANPTGMSAETLRQRLLDEHRKQDQRLKEMLRGRRRPN